jgi:hypothetical protein
MSRACEVHDSDNASSLRLLSETISSANSRSTHNQILEIRLDKTPLQNQPAARYSGVLQIETRYYWNMLRRLSY